MLRLASILALAAACGATPVSPQQPSSAPPVPRGPYLGQTAGPLPQLFAPGVVSRRYQELNAAFSPAGDELFFTIADATRTMYTLLHVQRLPDGAWTPAAVAPFSGVYADADPFFSADGQRLYFISSRPRPGAPAGATDYNLWYAARAGAGWAEPVDLGPTVNTPADDYYVSVTRDGAVFWSRDGKVMRAAPSGGGGDFVVEALPEAVNAPGTNQGDPYVAPDESYLIFASSGRPDNRGSRDLYVSFKTDGQWQPARSLGDAINSDRLEYCPMISPDGRYFFFTSYKVPARSTPPARRELAAILQEQDAIENGLGNIYWMTTAFLDAMRAGGAPPAP